MFITVLSTSASKGKGNGKNSYYPKRGKPKGPEGGKGGPKGGKGKGVCNIEEQEPTPEQLAASAGEWWSSDGKTYDELSSSNYLASWWNYDANGR